jgi:16S rRNA processing protein RimM
MSKARNISAHHDEPSGSPHKGEPVYFVIGKLRRPHGVDGEILFEMSSENLELFTPGNQIFVGGKKKPFNITSLRQANKLWLIAFEGIENREQAALITNQFIYIREDSLGPLPEGSFYHHEVVGMRVIDEGGTLLGEVVEVMVTGANDVYVVKTPAGKEILIPAVKSVILKMDRDIRSIIVHPQEWA